MKKQRSGHVVVFAVIVLAILLVLTATSLAIFQADYNRAFLSTRSTSALELADSGIEKAIKELNTDPNYIGESETTVGAGSFSITITGTNDTRTIESTGYVPNKTNPVTQRTIRVEADLSSQAVGFHYGVQVDSGGLQMSNNAGINGNVYSNGNITGGPGSFITGDAFVAGGINNDPSLEWNTSNPTDTFFATNANNRDIAQSFIAPAAGGLNKVSLRLAKVGNPSSNLTLYLVADNNGVPAKVGLTNVVIPASSISTVAAWVDAAFPTSVTLQANTKYWLLLAYGSNSNSNYWSWLQENGYASNTAMTTGSWTANNPSWSDLATDLNFRVWIGGTPTKIDTVAVGQTTSGTANANQFVSTTVRGQDCPNSYCIVSNPAREELPINDGHISVWKNYAASGGTINSFSQTNGSTVSLGPKKIVGDFTLANNSTLNITGALWITGNVTLSNNCHINLDSSYNGLSGTIIVDGTVTISQNCIFQNNSSLAGYILLLTTKDDKSGIGMSIQNNSAGVIYYAGKSNISFSQNAAAKEVTAYGILLQNNASVTYESGLANANFTSGPGAGWSIRLGSWREVR